MTTAWVILFVIALIVQGLHIRQLEEEIEAIKSCYPFCEIVNMHIPKEKGGDNE